MKTPNILFLMSDEHRFDISGFAGNQVIKTPTLDKLAKDAVCFNNAYTPSPVCIPARQCLATGKLPENCNCTFFGEDIEPNSNTFAKVFAQNAYKTCACGKLHHLGIDQMQGWTNRVAPDCETSDAFIENKNEIAFEKYAIQNLTKHYNANGRGKNQWEIERAGVGKGPYQVFDESVTNGAIQFIEEYFTNIWYDRVMKKRPLLLKVSLIQPHYPFLCDEEKFKYYMNRVPVYNDKTTEHEFLGRSQGQYHGFNLCERDSQRATAAYYGMIEKMDQHFGDVIQALENVGENLDDWIIIYTSDHGEMLGEHGLWEKLQFFEGSVRVPLFIRYPKTFKHKLIDKNVSLLDLYPTLCELCGIKTPQDLDGKSLVPLLDNGNDTTHWDNKIFSTYRDIFMCKIDNFKYHYYKKFDSEVLWDLELDPKELINFINDDKYQDILVEFRKEKELWLQKINNKEEK